MPSPAETRVALTLVTGAAENAVERGLARLSGSPEQRQADVFDLALAAIVYYSDGSSALAADFYDDERDKVSPRSRFMAEPVILDRGEKQRRMLGWATKPLWEDDLEQVRLRLLPEVQKEVATPFRDTITFNSRRDPASAGWERVASGAGCKFCRMLADRGAVYKQDAARFASHANCHCTARPVFVGGEYGPEASAMQYLASGRRTTKRSRERLRDYLAEHYGD